MICRLLGGRTSDLLAEGLSNIYAGDISPDVLTDGSRATAQQSSTTVVGATQLDPQSNPLDLTAWDADVVFRVFYPGRDTYVSANQIGEIGITLANKIVMNSARIQSVADIVSTMTGTNPSIITILRRIAQNEIGDIGELLAPPTLADRLNDLGLAAINGTANTFHAEYEEYIHNGGG